MVAAMLRFRAFFVLLILAVFDVIKGAETR